jgi:hypothetical protein
VNDVSPAKVNAIGGNVVVVAVVVVVVVEVVVDGCGVDVVVGGTVVDSAVVEGPAVSVAAASSNSPPQAANATAEANRSTTNTRISQASHGAGRPPNAPAKTFAAT